MAGLRTHDSLIDSTIEESVVAAAISSLNALGLRSVTWDRVRTATANDTDMLGLTDIIESGTKYVRVSL